MIENSEQLHMKTLYLYNFIKIVHIEMLMRFGGAFVFFYLSTDLILKFHWKFMHYSTVVLLVLDYYYYQY